MANTLTKRSGRLTFAGVTALVVSISDVLG
jgi:hypothetical protein